MGFFIIYPLTGQIAHYTSSIDIYTEPTPAVTTAISDVFQEPLCINIPFF